jgi:hypothetical protein
MLTKNIMDLPFKVFMELINANNGFYYSKDSKKKLNRYAGEVSRRFIRRSKGRSEKSC